MSVSRDITTAGTQSSCTTDLYGVTITTDQNSCQMLTGLYRELEPQLCKSYRRHVVYIPSRTPEVKVTFTEEKKKNRLKAVNMAIDVVSELQRKKDASIKGKKDDGTKVTDSSKNWNLGLPNQLEPPDS